MVVPSHPLPPWVDDREAVLRRLEALGKRVAVVTEGEHRSTELDVDERLGALRARVEARRQAQVRKHGEG